MPLIVFLANLYEAVGPYSEREDFSADEIIGFFRSSLSVNRDSLPFGAPCADEWLLPDADSYARWETTILRQIDDLHYIAERGGFAGRSGDTWNNVVSDMFFDGASRGFFDSFYPLVQSDENSSNDLPSRVTISERVDRGDSDRVGRITWSEFRLLLTMGQGFE